MTSLKTKTILVVDDEEDIVDTLISMIEEQAEGYFNLTTDSAFNGEQALNFLEKNKYDLMFLDLCMPNVNGETVISKIRAGIGSNAKVPIVVVSGALTTLNLGSDTSCYENVYFVEKPFSETKIHRLIKLWLFRVAA